MPTSGASYTRCSHSAVHPKAPDGPQKGPQALKTADLGLHLLAVLFKLELELGGLLGVAPVPRLYNEQPEGKEDDDATQHDGVDNPLQDHSKQPADEGAHSELLQLIEATVGHSLCMGTVAALPESCTVP